MARIFPGAVPERVGMLVTRGAARRPRAPPPKASTPMTFSKDLTALIPTCARSPAACAAT